MEISIKDTTKYPNMSVKETLEAREKAELSFVRELLETLKNAANYVYFVKERGYIDHILGTDQNNEREMLIRFLSIPINQDSNIEVSAYCNNDGDRKSFITFPSSLFGISKGSSTNNLPESFNIVYDEESLNFFIRSLEVQEECKQEQETKLFMNNYKQYFSYLSLRKLSEMTAFAIFLRPIIEDKAKELIAGTDTSELGLINMLKANFPELAKQGAFNINYPKVSPQFKKEESNVEDSLLKFHSPSEEVKTKNQIKLNWEYKIIGEKERYEITFMFDECIFEKLTFIIEKTNEHIITYKMEADGGISAVLGTSSIFPVCFKDSDIIKDRAVTYIMEFLKDMNYVRAIIDWKHLNDMDKQIKWER